MINETNLNTGLAYLFGLLCARGHIYISSKRIIIEFAHKNRIVDGIAHCPKCGEIATLPKNGVELKCKNPNCGMTVSRSVKKVYEQQQSTIESLKISIIPFLRKYINCNYDYIGNDSMTCLIMDFCNCDLDIFNNIVLAMEYNYSFDSFIIPNFIYKTSKENQIEFVNGLLDTAGFFNAGGWYPRNGKHSSSRMRAYFQIVRNWKMPVLICNFLKTAFDLPIQTIDWGHPNIRDGAMKDYFKSNTSSWSREHQVKFLPEYYINTFKLRLKHKQQMFEELANHNLKAEFDTSENCNAPTQITKKQLKPYHLEENSKKIPYCTRKHCDAFWQVCHNMGCKYTNTEIAGNEKYYNTGIKNCTNYIAAIGEFNNIRNIITSKGLEEGKNVYKQKEIRVLRKTKTNPEQQLYAPMCKYLAITLKDKYKENIAVHDTSAFYLDKFISQNGLEEEFEFCENYKIKPDIVGFLRDSKRIVFVEVKDEELTIQSIGQLLGYCLVARPEEAILVSPEEPSITLKMLLSANSDFLQYDVDKRIKIATWKNNSFVELGY